MKRTTSELTMTPEQFTQALEALGWRQIDFSARLGVSVISVSRWQNGVIPAPLWVSEYLSLALELKRLHERFIQRLE